MSVTQLQIVTAPDELPLTLAQAKSQVRVTHSFEDSHIQDLIVAATRWAEDETSRVVMQTVVTWSFHVFPARGFRLPGGKVTAVEKIDYIDADGAPQTLTGPTSGTPGTDYQEDLTDDEQAWLYPAAELLWPGTDFDVLNAVTVEYTVGFGVTPEDVPETIRHAIRIKLANLYNNPEGGDSEAADNLIHPYILQA